MLAKLNADGQITISFDAKERLNPSKSGKSFLVCKVQRPERVPGTEISFTLTAWIPKAQAIAEGLDMTSNAEDAA